MITVMLFTTSEIVRVIAAEFDAPTDSSGAHKPDQDNRQQPIPSAGVMSAGVTNGGTHYTGERDPNCDATQMPGFIIKLVTVDNTAKSQDYQDYMQTFNTGKELKDQISECQLSAIDKYLYKFPEEICDNLELSKDILIKWVPDGTMDQVGTSNIVYMTSNGTVSDDFQHVYTVDKSTPDYGAWYPVSMMQNMLTLGAGSGHNFWEDWFGTGSLTYSQIKSTSFYTGVSNADIENNIKSLFVDTSTLQDKLNGIWNQIRNHTIFGTDIEVYRVFYLDFLLSLNRMAGERYAREIGIYLQEQNANGCNQFVIPLIIPVIMYRLDKHAETVVQSLPDYYGYISNKGSSAVTSLSPTNSPVSLPTSQTGTCANESRVSQMQEWYNKLESIGIPNKVSGATRPRKVKEIWWSSAQVDEANSGTPNTELAFSVFPTDWFGRATGNIGYTYLALGGGAKTVSEYPFNLTASTGQANVSPGGTVAATVSIDMKQDDTSVIQNVCSNNAQNIKITLKSVAIDEALYYIECTLKTEKAFKL